MDVTAVQTLAQNIRENINKVIIGKTEVIDFALTCLLCGGHILLEDVPGTGKTMLAKSLATSLSMDFKRIQFTPDLLPSDVTGMSIYDQSKLEFRFMPGPIFANIILADEINRATPRSQSALLECMEEKQVTQDGVTRAMADPFIVIATQNPVETQGTFPLPEAQLDRFFMRLSMQYPTSEEAKGILERFMQNDPLSELKPVASAEEILAARKMCTQVHISPDLLDYIVAIVEKTRTLEQVLLGVSPRGSLALMRASQAYAAIQGRDFVVPEDVKTLCQSVLSHRMMVRTVYGESGQAQKLIEEMLKGIPVPTETLQEEEN